MRCVLVGFHRKIDQNLYILAFFDKKSGLLSTAKQMFHFHRKIKRNKISKVKLLNSAYYIVLFLKLKIAKCEVFIVLESHLSFLESWKLVIESWCYPEQIFCNPDGILITYFWNPHVIRSRYFSESLWNPNNFLLLFFVILPESRFIFCNPNGILILFFWNPRQYLQLWGEVPKKTSWLFAQLG